MVDCLVKTGRMVAMKMGCENATRRTFMLASSAQIVFAINSDLAFGQSPPPALSLPEIESMDRLIDRLKFARASDFIRTFWDLWGVRVELNLAIIKDDIKENFNELLVKTQEMLLKQYGGDNPIPRDDLHLVLAGMIFVQNSVFSISTNVKTGIITITSEEIQRAKDFYCSIYPYCK
jgi:hypothetical protein